MGKARNIADAEQTFVNAAGDTMTGPLTVNDYIESTSSVTAAATPDADADNSIMLDLVETGASGDPRRLDIALLPGTGANAREVFYRGMSASFAYGADSYHRWLTAGNEHMRVDISGNLLVGKTSSSDATIGAELRPSGQVISASNNDAGIFYRTTSTGTSGVILTKSDVGGTNTLVGAGFANGTFGVVSDINKKKNVEDARGYLNDLMQIRVVKYNWKTDEEGTPKELGWIAQEVEQVFPGMVTEMSGSKLLKKEVFVPMLIKAIQEQQAIINELKARVEALEQSNA